MRISDCSSDVCSSDLPTATASNPAGFSNAMGWNNRPRSSATIGCSRRAWSSAARRGSRRIGRFCRSETLNVCFGWKADADGGRSEEHTSELQSLMRISYAVFCLKKKKKDKQTKYTQTRYRAD